MATSLHRVATLEQLEEAPQRVTVDGRTFLVCESDGEVYAYRNVCPHQHGPVAEGHVDLEAGTVVCPWHGWEFDLDGGTSVIETGVADRLPRAETRIEDGDVYLVE